MSERPEYVKNFVKPPKTEIKEVSGYWYLYSYTVVYDETKKKIIDYCKANLTKYATPKEIEFIESLPVTISGSVDYRELERREALAREEKEGAERFGKN